MLRPLKLVGIGLIVFFFYRDHRWKPQPTRRNRRYMYVLADLAGRLLAARSLRDRARSGGRFRGQTGPWLVAVHISACDPVADLTRQKFGLYWAGPGGDP